MVTQFQQPARSSGSRKAAPSLDSAVCIRDVIPKLMKQLGMEDRMWEQSLLTEWESMVGPQVAGQSRPGRLERKTLFIFVSNSAWLSELKRYGQEQILSNLQNRFGVDRIKTVRLQLDPDPRR